MIRIRFFGPRELNQKGFSGEQQWRAFSSVRLQYRAQDMDLTFQVVFVRRRIVAVEDLKFSQRRVGDNSKQSAASSCCRPTPSRSQRSEDCVTKSRLLKCPWSQGARSEGTLPNEADRKPHQRGPRESTEEETQHESGPPPCRSWCLMCVSARGCDEPHHRRQDQEPSEGWSSSLFSRSSQTVASNPPSRGPGSTQSVLWQCVKAESRTRMPRSTCPISFV